jgi:hypothetical protein
MMSGLLLRTVRSVFTYYYSYVVWRSRWPCISVRLNLNSGKENICSSKFVFMCTCGSGQQLSASTTEFVKICVAQGKMLWSNSFLERPAEGRNVGDDDQTACYAQCPI